MKNSLSLVLAVAIAIPFMAPRAEAQFVLIPHAGYDIEFESLFVGVATEFNLLPANGFPVALSLRPGAAFYLLSDVEVFDTTISQSLIQIDAEVIAGLVPGPIGVYAGAGVGLGLFSVSVGNESESDTEFGFNVLGGATFGTGAAVPFAQARITTVGTTRFQVMGGVRVTL